MSSLSEVRHAEARPDIVEDLQVLETGVEEDLWIVGGDHQRGVIDDDHPIVEIVDVVRPMEGIEHTGMIDHPLVTDRVDENVPEIEGIRIVDRDLGINDLRWIVLETGNDLPIVRKTARIKRGTRRSMIKLKDRPTRDRVKNCETEGLSRVARKVARVVPLAMRMKQLGEYDVVFFSISFFSEATVIQLYEYFLIRVLLIPLC